MSNDTGRPDVAPPTVPDEGPITAADVIAADDTPGLPKRTPQFSALHWLGRVAVFVVPLAYVYLRVLGKTGVLGDGWSNSGLGLLADAFIIAIAVMGVNLITGFTGQLSIGHAAFFALGAYTGLAMTDGRVTTPFFGDDNVWTAGWTIPVAALLCFMVGCVVGLPALRLKGIYLALTTLVFVEATRSVLKYERFDGVTGGATGIKGDKYSPPPWAESIGLEGRGDINEWFIYLSLALLLLIMLLVAGLMRSRIGRSMVATRDNELAAEVMGVNLSVVKSVVFGLSGAITGVGGALFGLKLGLVDGDVPLFGLLGAVTFLVAMVVGGSAQVWGPLVGAVFYVFANERARSVGEAPGDFDLDFQIVLVLMVAAIVVIVGRYLSKNLERIKANVSNEAVRAAVIVVGSLTAIFVLQDVLLGIGSGRKLDGLGGVVFGVLLVLFARFAPFGVVGTFRLARNRIVQVVPKPPIGAKVAPLPPSAGRPESGLAHDAEAEAEATPTGGRADDESSPPP
ncbi:MAG: branched-chain amino acid ABC transporter permease [Ilumatobacter sp.]|uniref:branched-chain amino acid ABC transporter permease n=1 Tax=Ilumatobacter sp. TaxID=1967498 RepID=UPI0032981E25